MNVKEVERKRERKKGRERDKDGGRRPLLNTVCFANVLAHISRENVRTEGER